MQHFEICKYVSSRAPRRGGAVGCTDPLGLHLRGDGVGGPLEDGARARGVNIALEEGHAHPHLHRTGARARQQALVARYAKAQEGEEGREGGREEAETSLRRTHRT